MSELTEEQTSLIEQIDAMSHEQLARAWRFSPLGDPLCRGPVGRHLAERLDSFGGITPEISKQIGWDPEVAKQLNWKIDEPAES